MIFIYKLLYIDLIVAQEKMDMMTGSATAWVSQFNADLDDDDDYKAAECAESFITLLTAITGNKYIVIYSFLCVLIMISHCFNDTMRFYLSLFLESACKMSGWPSCAGAGASITVHTTL